MSVRVLIVDDQENQRDMLARILSCEGNMEVLQADNGIDALQIVKESHPEVVLTDLKMPGKSGLSLLEELASLPISPEVILVTAFGSIETAIKATKLGAYDYITKPVKPEELLFVINKANEKYLLKQESALLKKELTDQVSATIIAQSPAMNDILEMVETVARTDSTVMIRGETGTGKECIAQLIHLKSKRFSKPMRSINCAAISETILDSELFGYEKGAFTGANNQKIGIIEAASGGTLFLDEIGDMTLSTQAKILRTIQERRIRRVGGTEDIPVDIRLVAATNRNLEQAVTTGQFRQDLYYRLNVVPIRIPPLRERPEDIPVLIEHFLKKFGQRKGIEAAALTTLCQYFWPGNVRELEATIERIAVLSHNPIISVADLPPEISHSPAFITNTPWDIPEGGIVFEELEKELLTMALKKADGNMASAAKLLGMTYRAFRYRANAFGLRGE